MTNENFFGETYFVNKYLQHSSYKTAKSNSTQYPNPENVQNSTVIQNKNQTAFTQGHNDHSSNISPHDCKLCRIILTFKHDLCSAKAKV